ncbi:MAG: sulfatase-like hydrolase/transferase [Ignavibacteria bacterium]
MILDYNMITGMADDAINYLNCLMHLIRQNRSFFFYYVPGGTHAPHQPKAEWRDKFKGKFDMVGTMRVKRFANQETSWCDPAEYTNTPRLMIARNGKHLIQIVRNCLKDRQRILQDM